jgi:hypothetical protein
MISRRHGPTHLVEKPSASMPQPAQPPTNLPGKPGTEPDAVSNPTPESVQENPEDSEQEQLRL